MRDPRIDFLRTLGLFLIILAHINCPPLLFELRHFDVPLMVLISGISFTMSDKKSSYIEYVYKRFNRLVLPTWTFLTLFFTATFLLNLRDYFHSGVLFGSYILTSGIGYVWIIRVFFIVAILAPLLKKFTLRIESNWLFLGIILLAMLLNEAFITVLMPYKDTKLVTYFFKAIWDGVSYSLVFLLGLRFYKYNFRQFSAVILVTAIIFLGISCNYYFHTGKILQIHEFKYPPRIYYLAYSILVSTIAWYLSKHVVKIESLNAFWLFIGGNTLWIYFWHIVLIILFPLNLIHNYVIRYLLVLCLSTIIYCIQYGLFKRLILPSIKNQFIKNKVRMLFLG